MSDKESARMVFLLAETELFWPWDKSQRTLLLNLIKEFSWKNVLPFSALSWNPETRTFRKHSGEPVAFNLALYNRYYS